MGAIALQGKSLRWAHLMRNASTSHPFHPQHSILHRVILRV